MLKHAQANKILSNGIKIKQKFHSTENLQLKYNISIHFSDL